jgi:hypothetical protein
MSILQNPMIGFFVVGGWINIAIALRCRLTKCPNTVISGRVMVKRKRKACSTSRSDVADPAQIPYFCNRRSSEN